MDYKYIEQLLERYWECETTLEEEQILRTFFRQVELPAHMERYRSLFAYQERESKLSLSEDFDQRVLAALDAPVVKAKHVTLWTRFMPVFKAAAMIILLLTVGNLAKQTIYTSEAEQVAILPDTIEEKVIDVQVAYQQDSLKGNVQELLPTAVKDSIQ